MCTFITIKQYLQDNMSEKGEKLRIKKTPAKIVQLIKIHCFIHLIVMLTI